MEFSDINASQTYFWLKNISGCESFLSKIRGFIKLQKDPLERFFQFLMLNISSIKELLHKPSEIQWNITGTLPGRLKRNFCLTLSYLYLLYPKRLLPEIIKNIRNCYFGGLGTNVEFNDFLWFCKFLKVSASIFWLKNSFKFKLGFSLILNISQGVSSEKNILCSD